MPEPLSRVQRTERFDLRALYETSRLLSASLDLDFVLNNLLLTAMSKLLVTKGVALLYEPLQGGYRVNVSKGLSGLKKDSIVTLGEIATERMMREDEVPVALAEHGVVIAIPVAFGHREIGMLGLGRKMMRQPFEEQELEFILSLVNMSSAAVHNSLMVEELKQANRDLDTKIQQLNALFDLSQEFNATIDRKRLVKLLSLALMGQMLISKYLLVLRRDQGSSEDSADFLVAASKGVGRNVRIGSRLAKELAKTKELVLLQEHEVSDAWDIVKEKGVALALPILHQGETYGFLMLGPKMTKQPYKGGDIEFLFALANIAFVSIRNSHLVDEQIEKERLEKEMHLARDIQEGLLPGSLPESENLQIAAHNIPSRHVGGDYYDVVKLDDDRILFAIADVTGKGVPASLLMANLQACLQMCIPLKVSLEEGTSYINRVICDNTSYDKFITFAQGIYDGERGIFDYVNAGHNPPTLVRADGSIELLEKGGLLLGVMRGMPYERGQVEVRQGDVLALFTDGVTEAMSPEEEEYGEERLEALLVANRHRTAQEILAVVQEDIDRFTENPPYLSDDLTMIVLKVV